MAGDVLQGKFLNAPNINGDFPAVSNINLLIHDLTSRPDEALEILSSIADLDLGEGNPIFRKVMKNPYSGNDYADFFKFLKAYPNEARDLALWAAEEITIDLNDRVMDFYAKMGMLKANRATRPHDRVYTALGLEVPPHENRLLSERHERLVKLQNKSEKRRADITQSVTAPAAEAA